MKFFIIGLLALSSLSSFAASIGDVSCTGKFKNGDINYDMEGNRFEKILEAQVKFSSKLSVAVLTISQVELDGKLTELVKEVVTMKQGDDDSYFESTNKQINIAVFTDDGKTHAMIETLATRYYIPLKCSKL